MEGSLINNIIDDEIIDHELSEGIEDSSNDMINDQLNKNIFNVCDNRGVSWIFQFRVRLRSLKTHKNLHWFSRTNTIAKRH